MTDDGAASQSHISEMIDIVNDDDVVIGSMPRAQAYAENHRKRIVYVFVIDPETHHIGLAVRGKNVSWRPLHYTATVGGHVMAGETADMAAMREMYEEIGIDRPVILLDKQCASDPTNDQRFIDYIYVTCAAAEDLRLDPVEVERVEFMPLADALKMLENSETLCHPKLREHLDALQDNQDIVDRVKLSI